MALRQQPRRIPLSIAVASMERGKAALPTGTPVRWADRSMMAGARQRRILAALWKHGSLSRRALHDCTGIRPNTITLDVSELLECEILRETDGTLGQRGRPAIPLEIDRDRRDVLGVAIEPHRVSIARLDLGGRLLETRQHADLRDVRDIITSAEALLASFTRDSTLAVGLSASGSVDPGRHRMLSGPDWHEQEEFSLERCYDLVGDRPFILDNDMHALAARWVLHRKIDAADEDTLLVDFEDGRLGASLLVNGRPNRGCVASANELGHTRLPVETERCHCGQCGCLERICSSKFLQRRSGSTDTLARRAADYRGSDEALAELIDLLAMGIANAVTFSRVHRLVLISEFTRHPSFTESLIAAIRGQIVSDVEPHVQIEVWQQVARQAAETAGWLALANLFLEGWNDTQTLTAFHHGAGSASSG